MLILAAGASSRMKECKPLLPWEGVTLVEHAIQQGLTTEEKLDIYVVLGHQYEEIKKKIDHTPCFIINHTGWKKGVGTSISYGVKSIIKNNPKTEAILITLIDQPLIKVEYYNRLVDNFFKFNQIVCTSYVESIGIPSIFPKKYFNELIQLNRDVGAKKILNKHQTVILTHSFAEVLKDLDTPEMYEEIYRKYGA